MTKTGSTKQPTYFEQIPVALVKQLLPRPTTPPPKDATTRATDRARMQKEAKADAERSATLRRHATAAQERVNALAKRKRR